VTVVFFLFLLHLSIGVLATLPLVPEGAGARFFKFCSASAVFMTAAGSWLVWRRFGASGGPGAPGGDDYPALIALVGHFLTVSVFYNRAVHFGWKARRPLLGAALAAGLAALLVEGSRVMVIASDLSSALLLGAAASAMVLGHWYLVVLDLPISALRRLTVLLVAALALRAATVGIALAGPVHAGYDDARLVAAGLWSADGIFVWMRLLFGIAGPLSLLWFIWKTVEIRSTQSATGILYVQLFLVMSGELLAKYLRVAASLPL
jgi:hypothetical protein